MFMSVLLSEPYCIGSCNSQGEEENGLLAQKRAACKSTPTDLDGNTEYADFEVNMRREKHDLKDRIQSWTCKSFGENKVIAYRLHHISPI